MTWFIIYMLSLLITGFAISGILMSSRSNEMITSKGIAIMCGVIFCPAVNTLAALLIIITVLWLYWFRPTKTKYKRPF